MTITLQELFWIIWIILTACSMIINLCVLIALKKSGNKTLAAGLEKGAETVGKLLGGINIDAVKDVVGLIKDIVKETPYKPDDGSQDAN